MAPAETRNIGMGVPENRDVTSTARKPTPVRHVPVVVIVVTLLILGGVILFGHFQLRQRVRDQICGRDARVLYELWQSEQENEWPPELGALTDDPADHLTSILETNKFRRLPAVKATWLFDKQGEFVIGFPGDPLSDSIQGHIPAAALKTLRLLKPVSHLYLDANLKDLGIPIEPESTSQSSSLLAIMLPLHAQGGHHLLGVAQFFLDGESITGELRNLDRSLTVQSLAVFFAMGTFLTFVLALAFRQLQRANALLAQRTQSLLLANRELALAAKTSAIGAVTAHLIHGLKNPLAGLQSLISTRTEAQGSDVEPDWNAAVSTTRRMQTLINETVRVLREQDGATGYELALEELAELLTSKMAPVARQHQIELRKRVSGEGQFNNRDANLIVLILENLVNNAIQATPAGKIVSLTLIREADFVHCEVCDEGPGLSDHLKKTLFKPCQSTKEGGSGIGLAISKQLAASLGAELELKQSTSKGCVFLLEVPMRHATGVSPEAAAGVCVS